MLTLLRLPFYRLGVGGRSPLRSRPYAAAPQTAPMSAAASAIEHALHSFAASLPLNPPPSIDAIANAGQQVLHTTIAAASLYARAAASAWSAWVSLANVDLTSKVRVASIPTTAAVIVSQTGANAPPSATHPPRFFRRRISRSRYVIGTIDRNSRALRRRSLSHCASGYVTQDQLAALANNLRSLIDLRCHKRHYTDVLNLELTVSAFAQSFVLDKITANTTLCMKLRWHPCVRHRRPTRLFVGEQRCRRQQPIPLRDREPIPFSRSTSLFERFQYSGIRDAECNLDDRCIGTSSDVSNAISPAVPSPTTASLTDASSSAQ